MTEVLGLLHYSPRSRDLQVRLGRTDAEPAVTSIISTTSLPLGRASAVSYVLPAELTPIVSSVYPITSLLNCDFFAPRPLQVRPKLRNTYTEGLEPAVPESHASLLINRARTMTPFSYTAYPPTVELETESSTICRVAPAEFPMSDPATTAE